MPWIRQSGAHTGNVPRRPDRVPSARPPAQVPAPTLLPSHRRVGRTATVRRQGVVCPPSGGSARDGQLRGCHVVAVQPSAGQVRLHSKFRQKDSRKRFVVRVVQGKLLPLILHYDYWLYKISQCTLWYQRNNQLWLE